MDNSRRAVQIGEQSAQLHAEDVTVLQELFLDYETQAAILGGNFNSSNLGDNSTALSIHDKQIKVAQDLVRLEPNSLPAHLDLAASQLAMGDQLLQSGDVREAHSYYDQGWKTLREVGDPSKSTKALELWTGLYTRVQFVALWSGDVSQAIKVDRSALEATLKSSRADPHDAATRLYLAEEYANLADALSQTTSKAEAVTALNKATAIIKELLALSPKNTEYLGNQAAIYNTGGDVYRRHGNNQGALESYLQAMTLFSKIQLEDPQNADARLSFAASCNKVGLMKSRLRDIPGAMEMYYMALSRAQNEASSNHPNEELFYIKADAYAGLAEAESSLARNFVHTREKEIEHWTQARTWCERNLKVWTQIKEPGALSPHGFYCIPSSAVTRQLAECNDALRRLDAKLDRPVAQSTLH
jgi:tetratricopeptide (TPR) repeat protein